MHSVVILIMPKLPTLFICSSPSKCLTHLQHIHNSVARIVL